MEVTIRNVDGVILQYGHSLGPPEAGQRTETWPDDDPRINLLRGDWTSRRLSPDGTPLRTNNKPIVDTSAQDAARLAAEETRFDAWARKRGLIQ